MPEISSDTQGLIVAYLALEGFGQAPAKSLQSVVKTWLEGLTDEEGDQIFTLSSTRPHPLKSGASAVGAYKRQTKDGLSALVFEGFEGDDPIVEIFYGYGAAIRKSQTANAQGTGRKTDDNGVPMPVRTIKANKFNYNGWMFKNIYRLAMGGRLDPDYLRRVEAVSGNPDTYLDQFDVETEEWRFNAADAPPLSEVEGDSIDTIIPETSTPSEPITPFTPTEATPGQKIKNPAELEESRFPDITPPTAEEEISLSTREWRRLKKLTDEEAPPYDFDGEILIRFSPSPSDPDMQPIASLISAGGTVTESADDFFSDFGDEDESTIEDENTPTGEVMPDAKWFMTPELEFSFKRGSDAFFRVIGDDTYEGQMWPVRIGNFLTPTRVSDVKVYWAEPSIDTLDTITGCRIKLVQEGVTTELVIKDGKCTEGFFFNESKGGFNLKGGLAQPAISSNTVVIYGHEIKGFNGLLNDTDVAPADTLTWSNLNNGGNGGDYTGDVNLSQSAQINSAIQTQISRFYGNPNISDMMAYWKNWTSSGDADEPLPPIAGGNNIIFNLSPDVNIQADIKLYEETNPAYLRPKTLKLDLGVSYTPDTGWVPAATEEIGVIAPVGGVWSQYIDFICKDAKSSEYFPTYAGKQEFMFPGDEKYLSFITGYSEVEGESIPITINVDRIADSIQYITYDISSITEKEISGETTLVVPAVRLAILEDTLDPDTMEESSEIKFITIPDAESDFIAVDRNGEIIGGTIEGGELSPPDPQIVIRNIPQIDAFSQLENVRRAAKQSAAFTITQDDTIVTNSIAWLMSDSIYYIVATNDEGESSLVKIDLRVGRDD
jgi:hypothetical protein